MFIERNKNGAIAAIHDKNPAGQFTPASLSDPEVLHFLQQTDPKNELMNSVLAQSDIDLVRVVEDLIQLLIDRNIINFTDLPAAAQKKIRHRQILRSKLAEDNFIVEDIL